MIASHDTKTNKMKNDIYSLCVAHNIPTISDDPLFFMNSGSLSGIAKTFYSNN